MLKPGIRRTLGILILLVSLALLAWGFWPFGHLTQTAPVSPSDLSLPTPVGVLMNGFFIL